MPVLIVPLHAKDTIIFKEIIDLEENLDDLEKVELRRGLLKKLHKMTFTVQKKSSPSLLDNVVANVRKGLGMM